MTYETPELRDAFHKLKVGLQVALHGVWAQLAKQGYFIHVESVLPGGELRLRIHKDPKVGHSAEIDSF